MSGCILCHVFPIEVFDIEDVDLFLDGNGLFSSRGKEFIQDSCRISLVVVCPERGAVVVQCEAGGLGDGGGGTESAFFIGDDEALVYLGEER